MSRKPRKNKQVMEMNKMEHDLKMELEATKKHKLREFWIQKTYVSKHQQQNIGDRIENFRHQRQDRRNTHINQTKC